MRKLMSVVLFLLTTTLVYSVKKHEYLRYIREAAETGWKEYPTVVEQWKKNINPSILWGYDAPAQPIYLADVLAFLYEETKELRYAERARDILATFGDLRDAYPKDFWKSRIEYRDGMPSLSNFFYLPPYTRAYLRIRESGVLTKEVREKIDREIAQSADFVFFFPEWGAHNRAMLRAEGLLYASLALPDHPNAKRWRQMSATLASDNLRQWEVEDATIYHSVWLYSLFSYAEAVGDASLFDSPMIRYYLDYFLHLFAPHGNIPDFGDANWQSQPDRYIACFEKVATLFRNPYYKYIAHEMLVRSVEEYAAQKKVPITADTRYNMLWAGVATASALTDAYRWADDSVEPEVPTFASEEVLDDVVGKKIVFRNGWDRTSTYLLLNYRDEGDGGLLHRDYLRNTLSVEEEKMHHGHSDENSISLLMSGGSVLLHDGGYRDALPSGEYGAYRADYFHNRVVARKNKRDARQPMFEFLRNSGAYRRVATQKVDFLNFQEVDFSRTRMTDPELGFSWDRVVAYVKEEDVFIVVDGIKILKPDYLTFTNLWHTRKVLQAGKQFYETLIDTINAFALPTTKSLLIYFPESSAKTIGTYPEKRHYQDETAIYQSISSHYNPGDLEVFITILLPLPKGTQADSVLSSYRLMAVDKSPLGIGLEMSRSGRLSYLCVKIDLESEILRENIRPRYTFDSGRIKYGDLETDAHFLFATRRGDSLHYAASSMTKIVFGDRTVLEALPNTYGLQLDGAPDRVGYTKWRFWEDTITLR
jgi:hypothetical protein